MRTSSRLALVALVVATLSLAGGGVAHAGQPHCGALGGDPHCQHILPGPATGVAPVGAKWHVRNYPDRGCYWVAYHTSGFPPSLGPWFDTAAAAAAYGQRTYGGSGEIACPPRGGKLWQDDIPLDEPNPSISPGNRGVVGKKVYLETGMDNPLDFPMTDTAAAQIIRIHAEAHNVVTWGDDSGEDRTTRTGEAWPGGPEEITHVYTTGGRYTITVTTRWEIAWAAAAGVGGNFAVTLPPHTVEVHIDQIQAVGGSG